MNKIKYIKLGKLPDGSFGCTGQYTNLACGENLISVPDDAELYFDDTFYRYKQVGGYWESKSYTGQYLKSKYYADKTYAEMVGKSLWSTSTAKAVAKMPSGTDFIIDGHYYQKCGAYIRIYCTTSEIWYICRAFYYNTSYSYMVGRSDWSSVEAKKLAAMQGELDKFGKSIDVDAVKTSEVLQEVLRVSKLPKALDEVVEEAKAEREKVDLGKVAVEIVDPLDVIKLLRDGECVQYRTTHAGGVGFWNTMKFNQKFNLNWLFNVNREFRLLKDAKIQVDGVFMNKREYAAHLVKRATEKAQLEAEEAFINL